MPPSQEHEYILGTQADELRRLEQQHRTWRPQALALFEAARFGPGQSLLDLGCGPGFTSMELARLVGVEGSVIARDVSARFLESLEEMARAAGFTQVRPSVGSVETLELEPASLDGAYARWLFCWLEDPVGAFARLAPSLRPGAAVALQDYFDWGAMRLVPESAVFDRAVEACMQSWADGGGRINVARSFPEFAERAGLALERFQPVARIGGTRSPEWKWLGDFFATYLPKLVERGTYAAADLEAFLAEWRDRTASGASFAYTPVVANAVFRKTT